MKSWVRRIRGAFVIGLTWGAVWFAAGMVLLFIVGFGAADVPFPLGFGALGFIAGVLFSAILGIVERRRRIDQMSLPRFAGLGALGGFLLSVLLVLAADLGGEALLLCPLFALSGAACAAGTLTLARRAGVEELLEPNADASQRALTGR